MKTPTALLPQTEVTVNDVQYRLTALPSVKGREALFRLTKILAPEVIGALMTVSKAGLEASILRGVLQLAAELPEADFKYFYGLFEPNTEVMAAEDYVPVAMGGAPWIRDYGSMMEVMVEHCRFNFGSFFAGALSHVKLAETAPTPSTNT